MAKLSQQLLCPNSISGQRPPGCACTKGMREEHWHPREYPRNLLEMELGPWSSRAIPDTSWNPRYMVMTLFTTPRESMEALQEFHKLLIYIKCVYIHYPGEGRHSESAGRVLTTGPPGNSLSYFFNLIYRRALWKSPSRYYWNRETQLGQFCHRWALNLGNLAISNIRNGHPDAKLQEMSLNL